MSIRTRTPLFKNNNHSNGLERLLKIFSPCPTNLWDRAESSFLHLLYPVGWHFICHRAFVLCVSTPLDSVGYKSRWGVKPHPAPLVAWPCRVAFHMPPRVCSLRVQTPIELAFKKAYFSFDISMIKRLARKKGVPHTQLMAMWLHERIESVSAIHECSCDIPKPE